MQIEQDRAALKSLRELHGVEAPEVQAQTNGAYYVEVLTTDGTDGVFHVFALDETTGPWAPPEGTKLFQAALERTRDRTRLPVKDKWAEMSWEPTGMPEILHKAVRRMEEETDTWLQACGIDPGRIAADELLNKLQDRLFGAKYGYDTFKNWYAKRMALAAHLNLEPLDQLLKSLGQTFESTVPAPRYLYMKDLFQVKQGSWFIRIFDLTKLVLDTSAVVEALIEQISEGQSLQ